MSSTVAIPEPTAAASALRRIGAALSRVVPRLRTAPSLPPVRAGVIGAATSVAGSYARGLLKEFPGVPEGIIDVIPVDLVASAIIAVAARGPQDEPDVEADVSQDTAAP